MHIMFADLDDLDDSSEFCELVCVCLLLFFVTVVCCCFVLGVSHSTS